MRSSSRRHVAGWVAALVLLAAAPGWSQPAFDATSNQYTTGASGNFNHTPVGTPQFAAVCIGTDRNTSSGTGVTYGGAAMALIKRQQSSINTVEFWGLSAPASGLQNVAWTLSAVANVNVVAETYTDATGAAVSGGTAGATAASGNPSLSIASAVGRLVIDCFKCGVNSCALATTSPGAGQTQRFGVNDPNGAQIIGGSDEAGAASVTMSWTIAANNEWAQVATELCTTACAAAISTRLLLLGVGQ